MVQASDGRALCAPAAERNREAIWGVLAPLLPAAGMVLEIASGTGQHIADFAGRCPTLTWQPSDHDPTALASIRAWRTRAKVANLAEPVRLDVTEQPWPVGPVQVVLCINLLHIAPVAVVGHLFSGAAPCLEPGAPLVAYGPFLRADRPTAPSNLAFDASLRATDPAWGLRHLDDVTASAEAAGFTRPDVHDMPANNLVLVFRRSRGLP